MARFECQRVRQSTIWVIVIWSNRNTRISLNQFDVRGVSSMHKLVDIMDYNQYTPHIYSGKHQRVMYPVIVYWLIGAI